MDEHVQKILHKDSAATLVGTNHDASLVCSPKLVVGRKNDNTLSYLSIFLGSVCINGYFTMPVDPQEMLGGMRL